MWGLAPRVLPQGTGKAELAMEMLVRAYDPCISCSTHVIDVRQAGTAPLRPVRRREEAP